MPAFRVLLTDYPWTELNIERSILAEANAELVLPVSASPDALATAAESVDAIMTCWAKVSAEVIARAARCRIVARMGIGLDNIDVAAATAHGMLVTNVPDYCTIEVAEHTIGLILALARRIAWFHLETKSHRYDLASAGPLMRLGGRTLGIVGLGKIGSAVAQRASALGMRVLATGRRGATQPRAAEPGQHHVEQLPSLNDLLAESDFVSLHLPLTPDTRHCLGVGQFAAMKPTAYLINTARGGLVDHAALAMALSSNRLAGAALDVQYPEPPNLTLPPFNDQRVIVTPHAAFVSEQSLTELRTRATRQVAACLRGLPVDNVVNR